MQLDRQNRDETKRARNEAKTASNWRNKCETTRMVFKTLTLRTQKDGGDKEGKDGEVGCEM